LEKLALDYLEDEEETESDVDIEVLEVPPCLHYSLEE